MSKDIRALAQQHSAEAIEVLVKLMRNEKTSPAARAAAAVHILDRAVGRPESSLNAKIEQTSPALIDQFEAMLAELSPEERELFDRVSRRWTSHVNGSA